MTHRDPRPERRDPRKDSSPWQTTGPGPGRELRRADGGAQRQARPRRDVDVTVVSKSDRFQFNPSFIWIPFGKRTAGDVVFPLADTFESHGVDVHPRRGDEDRSDGAAGRDVARALRLRLPGHRDGLPERLRRRPGPGSRRQRLLDHRTSTGAVEAAEGWARFLNDPGPVVVAATQGAACFGAAYEFVFNVAYQLKKHKLKVPVSLRERRAVPGALRDRRPSGRREVARDVLQAAENRRHLRRRDG